MNKRKQVLKVSQIDSKHYQIMINHSPLKQIKSISILGKIIRNF